MCPYLNDLKIPLCTANLHAVEILALDPETLDHYCRSGRFEACARHIPSLVHEEIQRVFG